MRKLLAFAWLAAVAAVACVPGSQSPPTSPKGEISIATDLPLLGQFGSDGRAIAKAVRYAVERQGRLRGYRLTISSFDDSLAGLPEQAKGLQNVKRMLSDPRVLGMIGPYTSFAADAEIPAANEGNLVMVSPSTTVDCLTLPLPSCRVPLRPTGENNFFRLAAPNSSAGKAMADFAVKSLNVRKFVVFSDGYYNYSDILADSFSQELGQVGGAVVLRYQFNSSTNDFTTVLHEAVDGGAEAVYVAGQGGSRSCQIRYQMTGIFPAQAYFLGPDGIVDSSCIQQAEGNASDRMVASLQQAQPSADPKMRSEVETLKGLQPGWQGPGVYTFAAFDCTMILIDAIGRAIDSDGGRLPTRQQVLQAVAATSNLRGVTGTWSFTEQGDATAPALSLYRVEGGRWTFWRSITVGSAQG